MRIATGHLEGVTRNGNLRRIAQRFLLEQEFRFAGSMADVYEELKRRGTIEGKLKTYTADEIIGLIEQRRFEEIPRVNGLRATVIELAKRESDK